MRCCVTCTHSHLQSFATPPPRVAVRRREVIRHADGRNWEKMENVEFRSFLSITARKSYGISKMIIFETVTRLLTCDYSPKNNTMSHLLPAVIWWPSSRCNYRCLLIGEKLNSVINKSKRYLAVCNVDLWDILNVWHQNLLQFLVCCAAEL